MQDLEVNDDARDDPYQLIARALPGSILLVDADGRIALASQEIERQLGYPSGALVGQLFDALLPDASRIAHASQRHEFMGAPHAPGIDARRQFVARRYDSTEFPVEVALRSMTTAHGTVVLAVVSDASAQPEIERRQILAVEEQLAFERLVGEVSAQLINLPAGEVDDAIRRALARMGEGLDVDRSTFFRIEPDGTAQAAVGWQRPGIPPAPAPVSIAEGYPNAFETVTAGGLFHFSTVEQLPQPDQDNFRRQGVRSSVTVPISVDGSVVGAVGFNALRHERSWTPEVLHRLQVFATAFGNVLARRIMELDIRRALAHVEQLRDQLGEENKYLRAEAHELLGTGLMVGESPALRRVLELAHQVAGTNSTVLLLGETGTGKELVASQIHELSARRGRPMVRVNCAAIPETLIESELFGREKGAFTGALTRQAGRFELADGSSIFLDEIGDLSVDVQVKLLRVLEERRIERLGSPAPISVNTRIIAATHRNLEQRVADGAFRADLYYRLNVFPIHVPPLRERAQDIPLLVWRFVEQLSNAFGKRIETIANEDLAALARYSWPGNIRELRNVVERAMIVETTSRLRIPFPLTSSAALKRSERLTDVETEHMRRVLESTGWRVRGAGGAAESLGLRPTTLETRMAKLGLKRPAVR